MHAALRIVAASLSALLLSAPPAFSQTSAASSPQSVADDLLNADRGFSAAAANKPAANAIAAMLDDNVVMFIVPQPPLARGKAEATALLAKAFAGDASTLSWKPVRAGVSGDGLQGFTYGFMTRSAAGKAPVEGKYLSYWIKRDEGWRLAAFKLVPREAGPVSTEPRTPALRSGSRSRMSMVPPSRPTPRSWTRPSALFRTNRRSLAWARPSANMAARMR